jgi:hypothetical protein
MIIALVLALHSVLGFLRHRYRGTFGSSSPYRTLLLSAAIVLLGGSPCLILAREVAYRDYRVGHNEHFRAF